VAVKLLIYAVILIAVLISTASASMITVPVTLIYQGRSATVLMAIDTGATITTIGAGLADRLGIPVDYRHGGKAEMADGRAVNYRTAIMDVMAGDMVQKNIDVNIMEYAGNRGVEGWLGMNFLDTMTMTIDWRNKRIYWSK
jgi:predicted aspartyl protease